MAFSISDTVSIDRTYLNTLIRSAHLNANDAPSSHPTITISRVEYETLLKTAREFANLRRNLMRGGVTEETLVVLTSDESMLQNEDHEQAGLASEPTRNGSQQPRQPREKTASVTPNSHGGPREGQSTAHDTAKVDWAEVEVRENSDSGDSPIESYSQPGIDEQDQGYTPSRPKYERIATRTVLIANLPDGTTHTDITAVVRGGQLLDVFLRTYDRSAQVSFLHSVDARQFLEHARRHDLYIKHKRVDVRWSDRHFTLPGHVASKIGIGATRNLVIRRCGHNLTEEALREDLEHIHNLVVIRVTFKGGSCFISTSSVHTAMFARTCMMSRLKYRGSKIEWDADECAQPLEKPQHPRIPNQTALPQRPMNPTANRFELLTLDRVGEEENVTNDFQHRTAMDVMV